MERDGIYTDKELVKALLNDDAAALAYLSTAQYKNLYNYALKLTADSDLIRDAIQDLFVDVWDKRQHLNDVQNLKAYLLFALRNKVLKAVEKNKRLILYEAIDFGVLDFTNQEQNVIEMEQEWQNQLQLKKHFNALTDRQREVIYLRFYQNLTNEDIAQVMGVNKQSVANLLHRTLKELKDNWLKGLVLFIPFFDAW